MTDQIARPLVDNTFVVDDPGGFRAGGRTYNLGDRAPIRYRRQLEAASRPWDPSTGVTDDIPPGAGRPPVPHIMTFSGLTSTLAKTYRNSDEAIRHSRSNAAMMRNDIMIEGPLEARMRMVALLDWSIEPEDEKDPELVEAANTLTKIVKRTPYFTQYRNWLAEAIWYGRVAMFNEYAYHIDRNRRRSIYVDKYTPISGDKLIWRYDDGTGHFDPDQMGVRVSLALLKMNDDKIAGERLWTYTPEGAAVFFERWERKQITVHKHMVRDGEYEDPITGSQIKGVGLRNFLYWSWYQKQETLAQLVEVVERTGIGFTVYYYPSGNDPYKKEMENAARNQANTNIILVPYDPAMPNMPSIEQIPPNTGGIQALQHLVDDFFGDQITRYILGQTLSSKTAGTGLGSGVAELHHDSLKQIVRFDASNQEETMTREFVSPLRDYNMPQYRNADFYFRLKTETSIPPNLMQEISQLWNMGGKLKSSEIMDKLGLSVPQDGDEVLYNPQIRMAIEEAENPPPPGPEEGGGPIMGPGGPINPQTPVGEPGGESGGGESGGGESGGEPPPEPGPQQMRKKRYAAPGQRQRTFDWGTEDEDKHPRQPEGTPGSKGGQFAPKGQGQSGPSFGTGQKPLHPRKETDPKPATTPPDAAAGAAAEQEPAQPPREEPPRQPARPESRQPAPAPQPRPAPQTRPAEIDPVEEAMENEEQYHRAQELYDEHLPMVRTAASRKAGRDREKRDWLEAAGMIGLWDAAQRFDPNRGVPFKSYASQYINGYMLNELRTEARQTRVARGVGGTGEDAPDMGTVADPDAQEPFEAPGTVEALEQVEGLLSELPEKKRDLLERTFGIGRRREEGPQQQKDIAAERGVSKAYISQELKRTLEQLRQGMKHHYRYVLATAIKQRLIIRAGSQSPIRYEQRRAPQGHTADNPLYLAGKPYVGGQWIPQEEWEKFSDEEKAMIEGAGAPDATQVRGTPEAIDAEEEELPPDQEPEEDGPDAVAEAEPEHEPEVGEEPDPEETADQPQTAAEDARAAARLRTHNIQDIDQYTLDRVMDNLRNNDRPGMESKLGEGHAQMAQAAWNRGYKDRGSIAEAMKLGAQAQRQAESVQQFAEDLTALVENFFPEKAAEETTEPGLEPGPEMEAEQMPPTDPEQRPQAGRGKQQLVQELGRLNPGTVLPGDDQWTKVFYPPHGPEFWRNRDGVEVQSERMVDFGHVTGDTLDEYQQQLDQQQAQMQDEEERISEIASEFGLPARDYGDTVAMKRFVKYVANSLGYHAKGETGDQRALDAAEYLSEHMGRLDDLVTAASDLGHTPVAGVDKVRQADYAVRHILNTAKAGGWQPPIPPSHVQREIVRGNHAAVSQYQDAIVDAILHMQQSGDERQVGIIDALANAVGGRRNLYILAGVLAASFLAYSMAFGRRDFGRTI